MYLEIIVLVLLLYQLQVHTKEDKEICRRREIIPGLDISRSFKKVKNSVISFFRVNYSKFEKKRRQIKKAFYRFLNEIFYNKAPNSLRFSQNEGNNIQTEPEVHIRNLIIYHGHQMETHTVLTPDGYLLSIHRIIPTATNFSRGNREIAILSHGLFGSSLDWILLGPQKALPYVLSDAGYDVWLPNFRGNSYSRTHMTKVIDSANFWNFSWHEVGLFDIPAIIDYVRETTGEKTKINFIAYCMSSSALLVLLSSSQRYNAILKSSTLLAPLVYMNHTKGPLHHLAELYRQYENSINKVLTIESEFKINELFDNSNLVMFCKENEDLCNNPLMLLGEDGKNKNANFRAKFFNNKPSGGSTKTIVHYLQIIISGQFQMFDLGKLKNIVTYGTALPPPYKLFNVKAPLILFNAINDSISTVADLSKLIFHIPGMTNHVIKVNNFSHLDFLWAESATQLVYLPLLKKLQNLYRASLCYVHN